MPPRSRPVLRPPTPTNHPVDVGQRSEARILAELVERGYRVLVPFGVNHRYDFVIDNSDEFLRVQCKTGRLRDGAVHFRTRSIRSNTKQTLTRGYIGEADVFLVYCPENKRVYAVAVDEASRGGHMSLRVGAARNRQSRRIHWAHEYELPG
jgi:hypothetical protein